MGCRQNSIFLSGSQIRDLSTLEEIGHFFGGVAGDQALALSSQEVKWFQANHCPTWDYSFSGSHTWRQARNFGLLSACSAWKTALMSPRSKGIQMKFPLSNLDSVRSSSDLWWHISLKISYSRKAIDKHIKSSITPTKTYCTKGDTSLNRSLSEGINISIIMNDVRHRTWSPSLLKQPMFSDFCQKIDARCKVIRRLIEKPSHSILIRLGVDSKGSLTRHYTQFRAAVEDNRL